MTQSSGLPTATCTFAERPEHVAEAFQAAERWFSDKGGVLQRELLFDAWFALWPGPGRQRRLDCPHRSMDGGGGARHFHEWLDRWKEAARRRLARGGAIDCMRLRLAPAFELSRRLAGAAVDDGADSLARAHRKFDKLHQAGGSSKQADFNAEVLRTLEFEAPVKLVEPGLFADRHALSMFAEWTIRRRRRLDAPRPAAIRLGGGAPRAVRAESGAFFERAPGRFPENPARLSPLELVYAKSPRLRSLFLMHAAENAIWRSHGTQSEQDRRRPRALIEVSVGEIADWHRVRTGAPLGLISTVRASTALAMTETLLALGPAYDVSMTCRWKSIGGAAVTKAGWIRSEVEGVRFEHEPEKVTSEIMQRFPLFFAPAHLVRSDPPAGAPAPDFIIRFVAGQPLAGSQAEDVRSATLRPHAPGVITIEPGESAVSGVWAGAFGADPSRAVARAVHGLLRMRESGVGEDELTEPLL